MCCSQTLFPSWPLLCHRFFNLLLAWKTEAFGQHNAHLPLQSSQLKHWFYQGELKALSCMVSLMSQSDQVHGIAWMDVLYTSIWWASCGELRCKHVYATISNYFSRAKSRQASWVLKKCSRPFGNARCQQASWLYEQKDGGLHLTGLAVKEHPLLQTIPWADPHSPFSVLRTQTWPVQPLLAMQHLCQACDSLCNSAVCTTC